MDGLAVEAFPEAWRADFRFELRNGAATGSGAALSGLALGLDAKR